MKNMAGDYFVIFAHVDQNSGLFEECSGGLLESLSGIAPFKKRVLGFRKPVLEITWHNLNIGSATFLP